MKDLEQNSHSQTFSINILKLSIEDNINVIDAIVFYCEKNNIDMETVLPLIDQTLKERIKLCAIEERYVFLKKKQRHKLNKLF
jgi:hypothetical protein